MRKKAISLVMVLAMVLSLMPTFALADTDTPTFSGTGDESNPYLINSAADLTTLATAVNGGTTYSGKYFKLITDITLSGSWTPIGQGYFHAGEKTPHSFSGTFDGNGKTISGLKVVPSTEDDTAGTAATAEKQKVDGTNEYSHNANTTVLAQGLFSYVSSATIKNLTIASPDVTGWNFAGALAGIAENSTITGITVKNPAIFCHWENAGGVLGTVRDTANGTSTVSGCTVSGGTVRTPQQEENQNGAGGLIGRIQNGTNTISGNTVSGTSVTAYRKVAGLVGYVLQPTLCTIIDNGVSNVTLSIDSAAKNKLNTPYYGILFGEVQGNPNTNRAYEQYTDGKYSIAWDGSTESSILNVQATTCEASINSGNVSFAQTVASIGNTYYPTLSAAVAEAKQGDTIMMRCNVVEDVTIPAGTDITLDLNGKTLTNTGDYDTITNNGTLTVIGSGNVNNDGKQTAALLNNGTATLKGGTFKRTNAVDDGAIRWYVVQNHGIMTLDGATIEQATKNTASALINGWSGYTEKDTIPSSATAAAATLTITSGTVLNGGHTLKQCSTAKGGGTFTINGGTFTCESSADVLAADADVTVNGGNFSGPLNARTGSISVTGGCYTVDPADYVAAGYKAVSGGYKVGSTTYSYKVSAVPANKIESVTAEAYKDDDADVQTEVIATVSGSTITVSGKLPSDDNKVVITYTCTDNTTGTATLNYANGAFTAAALTVGTTTYTINFDSLSVLSAEVKVAAPAVPAVSPVADNASDVEKAAVTEINKAIEPEASSHPSAEGLAAAVADSALETTTDAQGNTVTNVTTSAGTQTATQIIADKQVTIADNAATGLKAIKENSTDNPAVVTVVPVMKIAVTGADIVDGKQTLTLDITAMSQVVVTTKNVAGANINTTAGDSKQNAIAVGDPLEVTVNTPVTIKVPIPKILYDNAPLYIKHTHNNIPETVLAELSYSAAYYATFELSGLSEVTFLSDPRTCTINYYSDETGTDYESKTITPADTGNANGYMTMPTVTAPTGKTFSGWKLTATTSGGQATTDYTGTYTEFTDDMLTYFAGTTITARPVFTAKSTTAGGGSASPTFTITVNKSDNGTVTSSAASAAASATVTLTVAPATTKAVATAKVSDTSYTFTMPALNVTVTPTFKKASAHVSAKFTDVDPKGWYVDAIDYVVTKGLFNGITDTTFEPDSAMDRAMLVTVMYRLAGSPAVTGTHSFTDVPADAYYKTALLWAVQNKVVNGITDTTFGPTLPVTREQVAAILYRYAKANGADVSIGEDTNILSYDDAFEISEYAIPAFQWACGSGILQGDNNKLMPKNNATRAQIAAIMMRSAGKLTK